MGPHNPAAKNDGKKDDTAMTKEKMKQKVVDEINAKKAAAREKSMTEGERARAKAKQEAVKDLEKQKEDERVKHVQDKPKKEAGTHSLVKKSGKPQKKKTH